MIRDEILLHRLGGSAPLRYYTFLPGTFVPGGAPAPTRLVVLVHGISRNAREHIVAFAPFARRTGTALLAPCFEREHCRDYQRLGWTGGGWRADLLLTRAVEEFSAAAGLAAAPFGLLGYSGGAQFAHRYALSVPQRVAALVTCAAGYYTLPDGRLPFPYGADCAALGGGFHFDLPGFLGVPVLATVGGLDTARDRALRQDPELDALQGRNRVERARRWLTVLKSAAAARGIGARHEFALIPGAEHTFRDCMRCGLGDLAWPWLQQHLVPRHSNVTAQEA